MIKPLSPLNLSSSWVSLWHLTFNPPYPKLLNHNANNSRVATCEIKLFQQLFSCIVLFREISWFWPQAPLILLAKDQRDATENTLLFDETYQTIILLVSPLEKGLSKAWKLSEREKKIMYTLCLSMQVKEYVKLSLCGLCVALDALEVPRCDLCSSVILLDNAEGNLSFCISGVSVLSVRSKPLKRTESKASKK